MLPFEEFRRFSKQTIARSRKLRTELTEPEKKLWLRLRMQQLGGYKFRRQHPIGNYIADFACVEQKLVIDLDGESHTSQVDYDKERDAFLQKQGYRVLRFWNHEVMGNMEGVCETILQLLNSE